ncbi:MAG: 50S ribosomal protein L3 N(5)-glutamine methyltransferase [Gammaproteobacteria bacterium]
MTQEDLQQRLTAAQSGQECVESVADYFARFDLAYGHGTDNPADEAYWLVRAALSWDDEAYLAAPGQSVSRRIAELARRRAVEQIPLAYLLNEAWFAGLKFYVNDNVLIPRSPLAELIECQFEPWCTLRPGDRLLDLGTGSGCLAIAAAHHCPELEVDAIEFEPGAASVARRNIAGHEAGARVRLLEGDLFAPVDERYRIILSNPPYVPEARLEELPREYGHEPDIALAGGSDGLAIVARILAEAPDYLLPDGILLIEVGEAEQALIAAHPQLPATWLEFEAGGEGVLVLTRDELAGYLEG